MAEDTIQIDNDTFQLESCIDHIGNTMTNGHYIAHIKNENQWKKFNDTNITNETEIEVKNKNNYLFIYTKVLKNTDTVDLTDEWQEFAKNLYEGEVCLSLSSQKVNRFERALMQYAWIMNTMIQ